ncbi:phosphate acetyltransferase, partial [Enterococcus faecium]|nr:phosphate acetyltransferase [Enterococcus faecium]
MDLFEGLKSKIKGQNRTVVFPEGEDVRVLAAAIRLADDGLVQSILLGVEADIKATAEKHGLNLENVQIIDPSQYPEAAQKEMIDKLVERRKGKNTEEQVIEMLKDVNYFGTMLVYLGKADAMVSGAVHATGDTVRPALQIIKTKPGMRR